MTAWLPVACNELALASEDVNGDLGRAPIRL